MPFDFDRIIDRRNTGSEKWDRYAGRDVLPLWVADMDFASPPEVIRALHKQVDHGVFGYAQPTAHDAETFCRMCAEHYGWKVSPEWIVWLPGMVCALNVACRATGESGDGVLSMVPVYPPFLSAPKNMDRELITAPFVRKGSQWEIDWDRLEAARTARTRLFLFCHPHNPLGKVFRREELERVADFCLRHDIVLCSDEIHCDLILDDLTHTPAANLGDDIAQRTITLMAPSKTYNIPGLGCSLAVIPNESLRRRFQRARTGIVPQVTAFGFTGCTAAYEFGEPWRRELIDYLRKNRDTVARFVAERLSPVTTTHVEATYLSWLNVEALGLEDPAAFFEEHGVGLSDGRFFRGSGHVRLNFGCPTATLKSALDRMADAIAGLETR